MERWKQKEFIISTFDPHKHDATPEEAEKLIRWTKEANFNLVEYTWRNREEVTVGVEACEKVGMPAMVQDPTFGGIGSTDRGATDETVQEILDYYGKYSCVMGYYVWDEPSADVCGATRELTDRFRRMAPDKLAFSVVLPSYGVYTWTNTDAVNWENNGYVRYVDTYLKAVDPDVVSMDHYVFWMNRKATDIKGCTLWRDLGFCRKRAVELDKPLWFYYQGIGDFESQDPLADMTTAKVAVQMYAALAYGVKQLSCFTSGGLIVLGTEKTRLYDEIKDLNHAILNIGNALLAAKPKKLYQANLTEEQREMYYLDRLEEDTLLADIGDDLIVGRLADDASEYLMISNRRFAQENAGVLHLREPMHVYAFEEVSGTETDCGVVTEISYDLAAGWGKLFRLTK